MQHLKPFRHEQDFGFVKAVYGRKPPTQVFLEPCVSSPHSIDIAFIENQETLVRMPNGPTYARKIHAGTGGMHGSEPLEFVSIKGSSEFLELLPSQEVRTTAANYFKAPSVADFDELQNVKDQVLWMVASRFRAHAIGQWPLSELEAEELIRLLTGHLICTQLGGSLPRINDSRLSAHTLAEIRDYIEAEIKSPIPVKALAQVANRSPYHFMRTFTLTTGMKPHDFVRAVRMERAKEALLSGKSVKEVAIAVGYAPGHSFRTAFRQYFGVSPSKFSSTVC